MNNENLRHSEVSSISLLKCHKTKGGHAEVIVYLMACAQYYKCSTIVNFDISVELSDRKYDFADYYIRTTNWKQLFCQLSHNHHPSLQLFNNVPT